jgi:ribosomal protein S27E
MITLECVLCEGDVTIDSLAATSVDCPDCSTTVEFAADEPIIALAAA